MRKALILDISQFLVGGVAIYFYFNTSTISETLMIVCGLSAVMIPLQFVSNRLHNKGL